MTISVKYCGSATINALDAMASQISDEHLISARAKLESRQKSEKREMSVCGNVIVDGGTWGDSAKFSEKMHVCEPVGDFRGGEFAFLQ